MAAGAVSAPLIIPVIQLQSHRAKNHIDTSTPVCLQSDTAGVQIFYTVDGSRPAAGGRKYSGPVLLPAGRVSVRAVAVTSDGRQSSVVTKAFSVDQAGSRTEHEVLQDGAQGSGDLGSTPASRLQRQTDFLPCTRCLSLRPSDPLARFCAQCGAVVPPLPGQRLPPAEGGQMLLCVFCNRLVPANTHSCLVCEAPIDQQLQPQAGRTLQDHVLCVCCGSGNPAHISSCLTCETHLQQAGVGGSAPSVPATDGRSVSCSRCKRINHSDARYCDWCGAKRAHAVSCVMCWRCGASGHPYASYCASCGVFLEAPAPPTSRNDITPPAGGRATSQATTPTSHGSTWQATPTPAPAPSVKIAPPTLDQSTQTVGLYYPSATELHKKEQQKAEQLSREQASRDRRPLQTAVSPGRGYWRKQLDHVCAHLRSYVQNHAPFRALLGEPRLGQMVSAVIQEDGYEVSLTVGFASAGRQTKQAGRGEDGGTPAGGGFRPALRPESLSSVTERRSDELSEGQSAESVVDDQNRGGRWFWFYGIRTERRKVLVLQGQNQGEVDQEAVTDGDDATPPQDEELGSGLCRCAAQVPLTWTGRPNHVYPCSSSSLVPVEVLQLQQNQPEARTSC
ncbi:double zinc ribbon and ankyrin repeat-containing protein 1 [Stegastes partitus]|uniref:Double zinc ribbon and ankyrin repeat-containing protein 1 n=1 Tax=Stegastes partitus TaxID=144197 RepID=A0A9Y4NH13_9TELE|nr:PREDICTED: double zinc ribbon and ankyrin repeat-containing protein 1 [Stegastes partitus]